MANVVGSESKIAANIDWFSTSEARLKWLSPLAYTGSRQKQAEVGMLRVLLAISYYFVGEFGGEEFGNIA